MQDNYQWLMNWAYDAFQTAYSEVPFRLSRSGGAFPAWHYFLELTRRCNLRCKMCQYITYLEGVPASVQREGELSTEEWKNVIRQTGRYSFLTFTGGEPLLRKDFWELLEFASERARTHFITNATLLNASAAKRCVELAPKRMGGKGLNFLGVSLEGPAEIHNEIRQQPGAYEKSASGLACIQEERRRTKKKYPGIHITTVIQRENVATLHLMPAIVAENGGDVLNLVTETRMHDLPGLGEQPPGSLPVSEIHWPRIPLEALKTALDKTEAEARNCGIELRWPRMPREELLRYYSAEIDIRLYQCRSPWNTLVVGRTGDVYPCWLLKIGNVREDSLKVLWSGQKMKAFRRSLRTGVYPVCPGCCFIEHRSRKQ